MSTNTIEYTGVLQVLDCGVCHVDFAIDKGWLARLKRTGDWFWCPNGHQIHYSTTENQKLKREVELLKAARDRADARARAAQDQADAAERQRRAYKGQATRLRNRAAAGVCPCCTRTFQNLQRHMTSKHPDFGGTEA